MKLSKKFNEAIERQLLRGINGKLPDIEQTRVGAMPFFKFGHPYRFERIKKYVGCFDVKTVVKKTSTTRAEK